MDHSTQRGRSSAPARLLLVSAGVFVLVWAVAWVPVLLTGTGASLFLWPLLALLAIGAWVVSLVAMVMSTARLVRGRGRRFAWVVLGSAVLLVIGPIAVWSGPVQPGIG